MKFFGVFSPVFAYNFIQNLFKLSIKRENYQIDINFITNGVEVILS